MADTEEERQRVREAYRNAPPNIQSALILKNARDEKILSFDDRGRAVFNLKDTSASYREGLIKALEIEGLDTSRLATPVREGRSIAIDPTASARIYAALNRDVRPGAWEPVKAEQKREEAPREEDPRTRGNAGTGLEEIRTQQWNAGRDADGQPMLFVKAGDIGADRAVALENALRTQEVPYSRVGQDIVVKGTENIEWLDYLRTGKVAPGGPEKQRQPRPNESSFYDSDNGSTRGGNVEIDWHQTRDDPVQGGVDSRPNGRTGSRYTNRPGYDSGQQDRLMIVDNAPDMRPDQMMDMFERTGSMARDVQSFQDSGSTVSIAHMSRDGILTTGNVADSPITVYIRDPKTGKIVEHYDLTEYHSGEKPGEITRSIGDARNGLAYKPDQIKQTDFSNALKNGYEVIVTVDTDGAHERTSNAQRQEVLENNAGSRSRSMADLAVRNGATDNVTSTVAVFKGMPEKNVMLGVFDGHGPDGRKAAEFAQNQFTGMTQELPPPRASAGARQTVGPDADIKNAPWQNSSSGAEGRYVDIDGITGEERRRLQEALDAKGIKSNVEYAELNGKRSYVIAVKDEHVGALDAIRSGADAPHAGGIGGTFKNWFKKSFYGAAGAAVVVGGWKLANGEGLGPASAAAAETALDGIAPGLRETVNGDATGALNAGVSVLTGITGAQLLAPVSASIAEAGAAAGVATWATTVAAAVPPIAAGIALSVAVSSDVQNARLGRYKYMYDGVKTAEQARETQRFLLDDPNSPLRRTSVSREETIAASRLYTALDEYADGLEQGKIQPGTSFEQAVKAGSLPSVPPAAETEWKQADPAQQQPGFGVRNDDAARPAGQFNGQAREVVKVELPPEAKPAEPPSGPQWSTDPAQDRDYVRQTPSPTGP